jgi:hypothetical protein
LNTVRRDGNYGGTHCLAVPSVANMVASGSKDTLMYFLLLCHDTFSVSHVSFSQILLPIQGRFIHGHLLHLW